MQRMALILNWKAAFFMYVINSNHWTSFVTSLRIWKSDEEVILGCYPCKRNRRLGASKASPKQVSQKKQGNNLKSHDWWNNSSKMVFSLANSADLPSSWRIFWQFFAFFEILTKNQLIQNLLGHMVYLLIEYLYRDNWRVGNQREMNSRIRHQVGLELIQIHIEGTVES